MGAGPPTPAAHRLPKGVSPISRLATVELQLIMTAAGARDIIRFARCSRHLQQAARDPFVWRDCVLTLSTLPRSLPASFAPFAAHLAVDVCPVLPPTPHGWIASDTIDRLLRLASAVSVRRLDWSRMSQQQLRPDDWIRVLRHESMQSLRAVCLPRFLDYCFELDSLVLSSLCRLPLLDTLRFGVVQYEWDEDHSAHLPPMLTELSIRQSVHAVPPFNPATCVHHPFIPIKYLSSLTNLRTMELALPVATPSEFEQLWTNFASARIERLHIDQLPHMDSQSATDAFAQALQRLPCLSEVHLSRCVQPYKLIAAALEASALRRIILEAELWHLDPFANSAAVTILIKSLRLHLPSHPLVFAELRMPRLDKKPTREDQEYAEDARAQIAGSHELQALGSRFKLSETLVRNAIR